MSKTIEELAEQYVKDVYNGDTDFIDETESVLTWMFNKPLAQRLTDAEKEKIRTKYSAAKIGATECDSPECAEFVDMLDYLFGKEFFEEGKL